MASSPTSYAIDDNDLDDPALWAVIDSAAAASYSSRNKPLAPPIKQHTSTNTNSNNYTNINNNSPSSSTSPYSPLLLNKTPNSTSNKRSRSRYNSDGEVLLRYQLDQQQQVWNSRSPQRLARYSASSSSSSSCVSGTSPNLTAMVKHVPRTPTTPSYPLYTSSPDTEKEFYSPIPITERRIEQEVMRQHSLSGMFPSVSLFKDYQNAAMAILEKGDYTVISGSHFIKKSGWRKISFYFNLSFEIKDKTIEFDDNRNVQRAEFVVRAYMQGGRFSDGWGSCDRREKKFMKPNHDIPSTAETRAKNKACQDLLGIGEYRPGASHFQR